MNANLTTVKTVFLLDSDSCCLRIYEAHLLKIGVKQVTLFDDSQDFINHIIDEPDLVIIDHSMTPFNGLEVLNKIRRYNPDLPVVYLSGQKDMKTAINALKYGAFDYIIKEENDLENLNEVILRVDNYLREIKLRSKRSFVGILSSITKLF
jgi:DNA-binding NtrC family response regulator